MTTLTVVAGENVPRLEGVKQKISTFSVGTRKSNLALVQTDMVVGALAKAWPDYKYAIRARDTAAGDIDKVTAFKDMPVKNLWTHELETLMMENKLDLLVHALKGEEFLAYQNRKLIGRRRANGVARRLRNRGGARTRGSSRCFRSKGRKGCL